MTRIEAEIPRTFAKEGPRDGIQGQAPEEVNRSVGVSAWLIWTGWEGQAGRTTTIRGVSFHAFAHILCVLLARGPSLHLLYCVSVSLLMRKCDREWGIHIWRVSVSGSLLVGFAISLRDTIAIWSREMMTPHLGSSPEP